MIKLARALLISLLVVCVPTQAALAVSAGQCMALQHHQDSGGHDASASHEGHQHSDHEAPQPDPHHGKATTQCGPCAGCCASAAISSLITPLPASPVHDMASTVVGFPPLGDLPGGLDRPPRAL
jgi:hypothetical protein